MQRPASVLLAAIMLTACAHDELRPAAAPTPPPPDGEAGSFVMESEPAPPPASTAASTPAPRPRLSQTITLGQDDPNATVTRGTSSPPAGSPSVVVNNNVVVHPPATGGYYGGYGYGGYGGYGGNNTRGEVRGGVRFTPHTPTWGATGWEGAQRTAQPGRTPAVGGNWSPPPSYGPAQMK